MILPYRKNEKNKFAVIRVHYSADPQKNTLEWIARAKQGMPENGWKREYDIDYSSYSGKQFYPEFKEYNISPSSIPYKERETLYRGWDYGFHHPCCVITKVNENDQWCWLKVILGKDEQIIEFGKRVQAYCLGTYPGAKYIDADDVAGKQVSDKSEKTSRQILNTLGIYPQGRKQERRQGAEIIRKKLLMRVDGKPGILIDPSQTMAIDAMKGGLHYPDVFEDTGQLRAGKKEPDAYEKEGYYDHFGDATRYIAVEMFSLIGEVELPNQITQQDTSPNTQMRVGLGESNEFYDNRLQELNDFFG